MKYFKRTDGSLCAFADDGSQDEFIPAGAVQISAPTHYTQQWNGSEWVAPTINHTTASKLALLDYFDNAGIGTQFLSVLQADSMRYERWLAAQNISIDDPMVEPVRIAMGWTQQQVQDLFNALNQ